MASLLDTDHIDGLWTKLVERMGNLVVYGTETDAMNTVTEEGVSEMDAFFALAAAKTSLKLDQQ